MWFLKPGTFFTFQKTTSLHNSPTDFFKFLVNSAFTLCICPYRLVERDGVPHQAFKSASWWPQKIISIILIVSSYTRVTRDLASPSVKSEDPAEYFLVLQKYTSVLHNTVLVVLLWRSEEKIVQIVNFICQKKSFFPTSPSTISQGKRVAALAWLLYMTNAIMQFITNKNVVSVADMYLAGNSTSLNLVEEWWFETIQSGRINFFLDPSTSSDYHLSFLDHMIGVISAFGLYQRYHIICFRITQVYSLVHYNTTIFLFFSDE